MKTETSTKFVWKRKKKEQEILDEIRMVAIDPFKTDSDKIVFIKRLFGVKAEFAA